MAKPQNPLGKSDSLIGGVTVKTETQETGITATHRFGPKGLQGKISAEVVESVVSDPVKGTTYKIGAQVEVGIEAELNKRAAQVWAERSHGVKTSYEVQVPPGMKLDKLQALRFSPSDPTNMPVGASIKLDSGNFTNTKFGAAFRCLGGEYEKNEARGVSSIIEKTGANTIRVTFGPTEAMERFIGAGMKLDKASIMAGANEKVERATFRTATFDLNTPEGAKAYQNLIREGVVPDQNGRGVSGVQQISKMDNESSIQFRSAYGDNKFQATLSKTRTVNEVYAVNPDGTAQRNTKFELYKGVTLEVAQSFDANRRELQNGRTFNFTIKVPNAEVAQSLNMTDGLRSRTGGEPVKPGQTVHLSFNETQMREFMRAARNTYDVTPAKFRGISPVGPIPADADTVAFAANLAQSLGGKSSGGLGQYLQAVAYGGEGNTSARDKEAVLPGRIGNTAEVAPQTAQQAPQAPQTADTPQPPGVRR